MGPVDHRKQGDGGGAAWEKQQEVAVITDVGLVGDRSRGSEGLLPGERRASSRSAGLKSLDPDPWELLVRKLCRAGYELCVILTLTTAWSRASGWSKRVGKPGAQKKGGPLSCHAGPG